GRSAEGGSWVTGAVMITNLQVGGPNERGDPRFRGPPLPCNGHSDCSRCSSNGYLLRTPKRNLKDASSVLSTPFTSLPDTATCAPCSIGSVDSWAATFSWICLSSSSRLALSVSTASCLISVSTAGSS